MDPLQQNQPPVQPAQPNQSQQPVPPGQSQPLKPQALMPTAESKKATRVGVKILVTNLLIAFGYFVIITIIGAVFPDLNNSGYANGGGVFLASLVHAAIMLILAIIRAIEKKPAEASAYVGCIFLMPIIGFGLCAFSLSAGFTHFEI